MGPAHFEGRLCVAVRPRLIQVKASDSRKQKK
jgi:hypothetical protein